MTQQSALGTQHSAQKTELLTAKALRAQRSEISVHQISCALIGILVTDRKMGGSFDPTPSSWTLVILCVRRVRCGKKNLAEC
jgi:hypothetical protein